MNLSKLVDNAVRHFKEHSPEYFTGAGVAGVGVTAYVSAKAGYKSAHVLEFKAPWISTKEKIKLTWHLYAPVVAVGGGTVACIILATKSHSKRTTAAVTAFSALQQHFIEYRSKMVEETSKGKEQKAMDSIAQEHVRANPPPASGVIIVGKDEVLCCELYTGRYFRSSMETLRKAQNDVNSWAITQRDVRLDDFYHLLGLPPTDVSGHLGWTDDQLMDLEFSAVLTEDNQPCLAFRYNYIKPLK